MSTLDLLGMLTADAAQSQWQTPPWLARRVAEWMPRGQRILEPSCGAGNLLDALLRARHRPADLLGIEKDPAFAAHASERFQSAVTIVCGDFLTLPPPRADTVLMNPPFESNQHMHFVARALELACVVVAIVPASFEFGGERDRELWAKQGRVVRRARLPERVRYGGDQSPKFDTVVLKIQRRAELRREDEVSHVAEEVWRRSEGST